MTTACRTVIDLRSPLDKYFSQTLLLAASWHRHCADHARLEVLTVGGDNRVLSDFLGRLGIRSSSIPPGRNDDFSKSSNKIEAAYPDRDGRPVFLLDNDVCFFGDIRELGQLPENAIAASEPGDLRVTDPQWALIGSHLGLPLLRRRFTPVNKMPMAYRRGHDDHRGNSPERFLYLNSGAVLFPSGHDHRSLWRTHQKRINDFFRDHPLRSIATTTSDQAGFATSVAAHGEFEWLPLRFNYRRGCFWIGLEAADRIRIVHFTGDVPDSESLGMAERIRAYWQHYVLNGIGRIPASVPQEEKTRRLEIALAIEAAAIDIVREYDLESWLAAYRTSSRNAVTAP